MNKVISIRYEHVKNNDTSLIYKEKAAISDDLLVLVGMTGFEPATTCTPCKCATRLRYIPYL